ncbi:Dolichyl-phosphate-mannose--protein mannosyltransferase 4 [Coemansia spiralis]|uniref:Dolichyl-phosphate-mannose--protein mannosyltransferase n=2 Tax=Coemansia TaxID=4863 RepID=A0A9W8KXY5_9FUNG|nr:putative PMT4-dolichyl-phosphate-mannose--protein O-mannosyltransferase [Coemansia spiralis]KAJ1990966.1 Dolichyl-phosphate-mannose--protein mannosyltransferase 4 [Coemansia umbellata]KAJ2620976.1 Dolichyl-phosphate-mannose--protein mannosyltransferase 4 [Coemansia sp. RSA 1358]KAJ2675725.1 Dolichyl-phosphate-mannose--protein mannosyltransferase 4 [Coemansia spiralis]
MSVDDSAQLKMRSSKGKPITAPDTLGSAGEQGHTSVNATSSKEADSSVSSSESESRRASKVSGWVKNSSKYAFLVVVALSFITRYWLIWDPAQVVFDEVHFGKFASYYLRREYYFDVHPPLAKMLIALGGWLIGYDGHFLFEKIGMDYMSNGVPYIMLRAWVALFGFAIPPLVYMIMAESGYSVAAATLAALLVTFDNALVTQGRLILLDNIMIYFMLAAVYSYVRFFKLRYKAFSTQWWTWLLSTGAMLGCVVSCKLVGLFTIMLVGMAVLYDLWRIIDIRRGTTMFDFCRHFVARAFALIVVPFMLYLSFFYIHFALLTHTGPGDAYHTSKFQMQLIDSPMTKSSFDIHYGDQIVFRHRDSAVYLDSNTGRYPLRYEDQRVSSQGQQVTGAKNLTSNSLWMIQPAKDQLGFQEFMARRDAGEDISDEDMDKWLVYHSDFVQLMHVNTSSILRTHDVASPLTPTNMEFTTVPLNGSVAVWEDTIWQINIDGADTNDTVLQTSSSFIRLVSKKHSVAMYTHKKKLPAWGHKHQEINGNKKPTENGNVWTIPLIHGRKASPEEQEEMKNKVAKMGFFEKYAELQGLMIKHNNALTSVHPFQSTPMSWPLLVRGISFWTNADARKQIYLLGNPVGWWLSSLSLLAYVISVVALELFNRRNITIVDGIIYRHFLRSGGFIAFAWFIHYFPFFLMGRSLFLHHYLPASIFAYMMIGATYQFFNFDEYQKFTLRHWNGKARALMPSTIAAALFATIIAAQVATFMFFAPLAYGTTSMTPEQIRGRMWMSTYDLHFQK